MEYSGDKNHRSLKKLRELFSFPMDIVFPRFCVICKQEGGFICPKCWEKIKEEELSCPYCHKINFSGKFCSSHKRHSSFDGLIFISQFDSLAKNVVYAFKYQGLRGLAKPLGLLMAERLRRHSVFKENPVLVPVPIFITKRWQRGFNQAELLALEIAKRTGLECFPLILKIKKTISQTKLKRKERIENIKGAFELSAKSFAFRGRSFVLVDDVYTTGATFNEMAKELKKLAPLSIWGLSFARGS